MDESYPLTYSVDYPDRQLDRLSSALRIFWVIPIAIVLGTVAHATYSGPARASTSSPVACSWPGHC